MKISKFDLTHIWTYSNFVWDNNIKYNIQNNGNTIQKNYELWELNLFYWENGSWKSTLSKLFRVLNGETELKNDLKPWWSNIEINFNVYDDVSWNLSDKIKVFDKRYIREQVWDFIFDSDESTEQNKSRGEHFLVVWDFVAREKKIQNQEAERSKQLTINKKAIQDYTIDEKEYKQAYWEDYKVIYTQVESWKLKKDVLENNLKEKQKELSQQEIVSREKQKIDKLSRTLMKLVTINTIDESKWDIFQQTIKDSISFLFWEKESIKNLVELTHNHNIEYCLLCDQKIKNSWAYIERIQMLISQMITPQIDTISSSLLSLKGILDEVDNINNSQNTALATNKIAYDEYKAIQVNNAQWYPDRSNPLDESDQKAIQQCRTFIVNKQNKLSEQLEIWKIWDNITLILEKLNNNIGEYNKQIELIEKDIIELQNKQVSAADIDTTQKSIDQINKHLNIITNQKKISEFIQKWKDIEIRKVTLETERKEIQTQKKAIKDDFSTFTWKYWLIISKLIESINPWLARKINFNLQWTYTQWKWRCWFEIKHSESATIITKHLSDWEKRSIAFTYFLSQFYELNEQGELVFIQDYWKDLIIAFDDPSTDYDKNNKSIIASYIVDLAKWFEQTFVFTHDEKFRDYIIKQTDINPIWWDLRRYKISKNYLWKSTISILDKNQVEVNHSTLIASLVDPNPNLSCTAHSLRYCIEHLVRNDLLWESESSIDALVKNKLWWGGFDRIKKANNEISKLRSLYTFCNNNWSHYGEADWFDPLAEHIRIYFEVYDHIFWTTLSSQIQS